MNRLPPLNLCRGGAFRGFVLLVALWAMFAGRPAYAGVVLLVPQPAIGEASKPIPTQIDNVFFTVTYPL